ncbi:hypothetical protein [Streptomyces prasinus]|uniref:hypothetical protein n=1 Tax=Streptomyces prasinus TaxID=67345 RepID=UPI0036CECCCE
MTIAVALLAVAVVLIAALLTAAGAGMLARMDGATWPAALARAAGAFATALTLVAAVIAALSAYLT